jgi:hypothetical protein
MRMFCVNSGDVSLAAQQDVLFFNFRSPCDRNPLAIVIQSVSVESPCYETLSAIA